MSSQVGECSDNLPSYENNKIFRDGNDVVFQSGHVEESNKESLFF